MKSSQNLFVSFLDLLNVKHTKRYSGKIYNEHPYKYTLFGLSNMLSEYGIENVAIRLSEEKKNVGQLEAPFVAHVGSEFVITTKISTDEVSYLWHGKTIKVSVQEFNELWSGVALFAESDESSIEPNYKENQKKSLFSKFERWLLLFAGLMLGILGFVNNEIHRNIGLCLSLLVNLSGVYIGWLLFSKQINYHSEAADKICSLFKKSDCNDILQSPAAKFMGIIGWSEVGLAYFMSNVIILLFVPHLISYLALVNICALPYTFWSIWYQGFKAKQWCPLCLIVQLILWLVFLVNLVAGFISIPLFSYSEVLFTGCIYLLPILILHLLLPQLSEGKKKDMMIQYMNSLKMKDEVFLATLKKQPHYQVDKNTSQILLGNKEAGILITILTNPHCGPCARMHQRVDKLLNEIGNKICIQYIFSSFSEDLDSSNKILIASYLHKEDAESILTDWYKSGKSDIEGFTKKYAIEYDGDAINSEFENHETWRTTNRLAATPTILINGYELPDTYKIEDIKYFTDLVIDTK
ncbi:vitamin K epoxide reductase family protein [Dysgonomonas sp. 25]|uniref:vitamin K epoxide reductase family protein n=1 Tax=Dysgonomonas sp. 25 TaxID=2302933 RepID=UPI0013D310BD|nr:vitamin K epoxide reductase family protein [Dysgonomonas sp. 25]NDV67932.1 hypothetical protein [Dysgonomonas sp. 25]